MQVDDRNSFFSRKTRYTKLLIVLILLFFISPITTSIWGHLVMTIIFLLVNLLVIETLSLSRKGIYFLRTITIITFTLEVISSQNMSIIFDKIIDIESNFSYLVFNSLAILSIGSRIFTEKKVGRDIIHGGICIFIILGLFWNNLYHIILLIAPNAFQGLAIEETDIDYQLIYFSFTTLTTLGYGDITPINKFAMTWANVEAIFGLLYPSIFLARLVSLYTTQEQE